MQQLFKDLNENGYVEFHREDTKTGECLDIFLAHPQSILLAKRFPEVIVMDCTYKTNIHKLPLFEIVGFTSTQKTFAIAFVYLESEKEDNYLWALQKLHQVLESKASSVGVVVTDCELALMNAIPKVFPRATNLLCRWHIMTNIQARYKKTFKTNEEWEDFLAMVRDFMHSRNLVDYQKNLDRLKKEYEHHHGIIAYIEKQWISRYKEKFVSVWTDSILHFGTLTTNRAESMHAALKRYLGSSRGNLTRNWRLMDNFLGNQLTAIADSFNKCRNSVRHCYKGREYAEVSGLISVSALEMLAKELKKSKTIGMDKKLCGCVVKRTCGIPCAHELNEFVILADKCIPLSKIHPRWRKLDIMPFEHPRESLDITPQLERIKRKFNSEPDYQKVLMMKKCGEIGDPKTTVLQEPRTKANGRGRPRKSKNCAAPRRNEYDTRRHLSGFEFSQTEEEKQANQTSKKNKPQKATNQKSRRARKKCKDENMRKADEIDCTPKWENTILNALNPLIQDFITAWEDVRGDGHCGYRSVAKLVGFDDREGWVIVRGLLLQEMMSHYHEYSLMFTPERFQQLKNNLECRAVETYDENNWFTIPDMGWMVASAFNSVFVCIEQGEGWASLSFFPLRTPPKPTEIKIVSIAHIDKHFVPIVLSGTAPIPPLMPGWDKCRWPAAAPWRPLLQSKLDNWSKETLSRNIMARDMPTKVINGENYIKEQEMVQMQNQERAQGWIKPQNQTSQGLYGIGQRLINQTSNQSILGTTSYTYQPVQASTRVISQPLQDQYQGSTSQQFWPYIDLSCSEPFRAPMLSYDHSELQSTNIISSTDFLGHNRGFLLVLRTQ